MLERAEGNPLFTEELVYSLRDRGLISIEGGVCRLAAELTTFQSLSLPDSAQGVVTSRIDILEPRQQLTLKVASVMGRRFDPKILAAVHPIADDRRQIAAHLAALANLDLIQPTLDEADSGYRFKHSVTQEAAYELLPFAQRRELHRSVAVWHEEHRREDDSVFALLAHHWTQAEVPVKALEYLEKAGRQAERSYAYEEVARFFEKALALDAQTPDSGDFDRRTIKLPGGSVITPRIARRARWERMLGMSKANLGRLEEGATHLEKVLQLLGSPLPASDRGWQLALLKEIGRQLLHRLRPARNNRFHADASECLVEVARSYARLGSYYYVSARRLPFIHALLAALNAAELAEVSPELAMAYADAGTAAGVVAFHPAARVYTRLAFESAASVDQLATSARVISRTSIYRFAIGDWSCEADLERSIEMSDRLGDPYQWEESCFLLGPGQALHRPLRGERGARPRGARAGPPLGNPGARDLGAGHPGRLQPASRPARRIGRPVRGEPRAGRPFGHLPRRRPSATGGAGPGPAAAQRIRPGARGGRDGRPRDRQGAAHQLHRLPGLQRPGRGLPDARRAAGRRRRAPRFRRARRAAAHGPRDLPAAQPLSPKPIAWPSRAEAIWNGRLLALEGKA